MYIQSESFPMGHISCVSSTVSIDDIMTAAATTIIIQKSFVPAYGLVTFSTIIWAPLCFLHIQSSKRDSRT
jgi:hypothetical protein